MSMNVATRLTTNKLTASFSTDTIVRDANIHRAKVQQELKTRSYINGGIGFVAGRSASARYSSGITARACAVNINRGLAQRSAFNASEFWRTPTLQNAQVYQQKGSAWESFGNFLGTTVSAMGMLNQMGVSFGSNKSKAPENTQAKTRGGAIDEAVNNLSNQTSTTVASGNADVQNCLTAMSTATDSASLASAIENAKTTLASMDDIGAELAENAREASANIGDARKAVSDAGTQVGAAKGEVSVRTKNKEAATTQRDKAIAEFAKAQTGKTEAEQNYYTCVGKTVAAQSDVGAATERLTTAKGGVQAAQGEVEQAKAQTPANPAAVAAAEAQLAGAKAEEKAAQTALDNANKALEGARKNENEAKTKFTAAGHTEQEAEKVQNDANAALSSANKEVAEANENLEKSIGKQSKAETQEKFAKEKFEELNSAAGKLTNHQNDQKLLQKEIANYENKLSKMEKVEQKRIDKAVAKYDKNHITDDVQT